MTNAYVHRPWSPIGAIELKCSYRKNMTLATIWVTILFMAAIGTVALLQLLAPAAPIPKQIDRTIEEWVKLMQPPSVKQNPAPTVRITEDKPEFNFNTNLLPVDDASIGTDYVMASPDDLAKLSDPPSDFDPNALAGIGTGHIDPGDLDLGQSPEFVPYDQNPEFVKQVVPEYPAMARRLGLEAKVIVEVHIDANGDVSQARVIKCTTPNVGFEEAAVAAALKTKWRPAMQNKQPVKVWVAYTMDFKLK